MSKAVEMFNTYIAGKVNLKQSTWINYLNMYRNYVRDELGGKALHTERVRQFQQGGKGVTIDGYTGFMFTNRFGDVFTPHTINRAIERTYKAYNVQETAAAPR